MHIRMEEGTKLAKETTIMTDEDIDETNKQLMT